MAEAGSLRLPVRALWSVPIAAGFVGLCEALTQSSTQGVGVVELVLAIAAGALTGLWPVVFLLPLALVADRRERASKLLDRLDGVLTAPPASAAALGVAVALVFVMVGPLVEVVVGVSGAHPVDYPETRSRLWTAGLLAAVPVAFVMLALLTRLIERLLQRVQDKPWASRWLTRVAVAVFAGVCVGHLVSGPFFIYLGGRAAFALLAMVAACAALWLPRHSGPTTLRMLAHLLGLGLVVILGVVGLRSATTRALLLHDTRVFPHLLDAALGGFDTDDDGSYPTWLGGADCDNIDPEVSPWQVELLGNGVDDDCRGGDLAAPEQPAAAPPSSAATSRPPVFLITIDTLRLDRTELGGYGRPTMPALAAFARAGRWYTGARAPANHTFFSMVSLLAGQSPERMLLPGDRDGAGRISFRTWLPARLGQLGYATLAINPPLVLDGKLPPEQLRFDHIEAGRYDYAGKNRGTTARQVVDDVLRILGSDPGQQPVFAWVHFMDPHASHEAPTRFTGDDAHDAYDNELSWVDLHLGRMLAFIDERYPDAIVIITSDHGEEFGERGNYGHGFTLADSELRVPLALSGPGIAPGVDERPVSTVGVAPMVLGLLGEPIPPAMSPDLLLLDDDAPVLAANPAFLWNEARMEVALVDGDWKLIHGRMRNTWLLYDLAADPEETQNLVADAPERFEAMQALLASALDEERLWSQP